MLSAEASRIALESLFRKRLIADLESLFRVLETTSRMSVFRRLSAIAYLSSYSDTGRYYTLRDIPQFDTDGLWHHDGVGFSRLGTLRATTRHLVEVAEAGRTQAELQARLRVRVHNTLLDLVKAKEIGRESWEGEYLYVAKDPERATAQTALRQRTPVPVSAKPEGTTLTIEVLLEVIRAAGVRIDAASVAARLASRGVSVAVAEVESILDLHGVKKTGRSRSRRSRR